ncbi:eCIS core domain-containing protein [Flavilitoribacter nigricans]
MVAQRRSKHTSSTTMLDQRPAALQAQQQRTFLDQSPQVSQLRALQDKMNSRPNGLADTLQRKSESVPEQNRNNTGLPDRLKSGIEHLSGYSMDDVRVHYNSVRPAQLQAHAYAQGTDIHLAPGQEKHLPHEAWHVVQQKQGRVRPTMQLKGKVNINDDEALEREADVMGAQAKRIQ